MVQLDNLIIVSQLQFLLFFFLGYFFFLKKILPIISIELKFKQKVLLHHMNWLYNNINKLVFYRTSSFTLLARFKSYVDFFYYNVSTKRNIFYGVYGIDLLSIKSQYLNRRKI
jgi:hypothetical protein